MMKTLQLIFIFVFCFEISVAQQPKQSNPELPNTIENQFKKLYKNSSNYQIYRVIKKDGFFGLQQNVLDSITTIKKETLAKQQTIISQQQTITTLENKIVKLTTDLSTSADKENSISLFGLQLNKTTYNIILWAVIAGLLISLLFFLFKFNSSNSLTNQAKKALVEVEQEFEKHRKKSLEKEQKLRRQLQDEVNKQRGI